MLLGRPPYTHKVGIQSVTQDDVVLCYGVMFIDLYTCGMMLILWFYCIVILPYPSAFL